MRIKHRLAIEDDSFQRLRNRKDNFGVSLVRCKCWFNNHTNRQFAGLNMRYDAILRRDISTCILFNEVTCRKQQSTELISSFTKCFSRQSDAPLITMSSERIPLAAVRICD